MPGHNSILFYNILIVYLVFLHFLVTSGNKSEFVCTYILSFSCKKGERGNLLVTMFSFYFKERAQKVLIYILHYFFKREGEQEGLLIFKVFVMKDAKNGRF